MANMRVKQVYIDHAARIYKQHPTLALSNHVHQGAFLQAFAEGSTSDSAAQKADENLNQERERLCRNVTRLVNAVAFRVARKRGEVKASNDSHAAIYRLIENKFSMPWREIKNTWKADRIREVVVFLEKLLTENSFDA